MRTFRFGQHFVVATLSTAVLAICQQLLSTPVPAASTRFSVTAPQPRQASAPAAAFMPAAVPTGEYEELVRPTPTPMAVDVAAEPESELEAATIGDSKPLLYETGFASTYGRGDGFEGKRTGCGRIFHTHEVQVAHKTLPCGTLVRIEDTRTGKTVDAEVSDRGPYVAGRIVDLSYAALTQLDATGTGLLPVNLYILETSNQYAYKLR